MCDCGTCDECLTNVSILKGLNGLNGIDGNRILSGNGNPSNTLGNDNDFYVDKLSPMNFYQKAAGVWTYIGRLQGIDGNGFLISEETLISASDMLTSWSSPVPITQIPPAGYYIVPISVNASIRFNTTAYGNASQLTIIYNNPTHVYIGQIPSTFLTTTQPMVIRALLNSQDSVSGVGLAIRSGNNNLISGDSPILVRVIYYIASS